MVTESLFRRAAPTTSTQAACAPQTRYLNSLAARIDSCAPAHFDLSIASRTQCKHVPRMIPGFETRSSPNLLVATLATLPSISLVP